MGAANDNERLPRSRAEAKAAGSKRYFTGKPCKRGHVAPRYTTDGGCKECCLEDSNNWKRNNPDKVKATRARWREENREWCREYSAAYRKENPEQVKATTTKWRAENPEKIKEYTAYYAATHEEQIRQSRRNSYEKRKATARGRLQNSIKTGVHNGLKRGAKAGRKTFDLLGYTVDELKRHLEKRFKNGMSWDNYGRGGWEIDHIIPQSAFNFDSPEDFDFKRCWALSNLTPLWDFENRSKNGKLDKPFQPSLALPA